MGAAAGARVRARKGAPPPRRPAALSPPSNSSHRLCLPPILAPLPQAEVTCVKGAVDDKFYVTTVSDDTDRESWATVGRKAEEARGDGRSAPPYALSLSPTLFPLSRSRRPTLPIPLSLSSSQLNGDKLIDPAAIGALTASLEILVSAPDTAATGGGRTLSRAASKRPALKGETGNPLLANLMGE